MQLSSPTSYIRMASYLRALFLLLYMYTDVNATWWGDSLPQFCTGSCPVLYSCVDTIREQQLKRARNSGTSTCAILILISLLRLLLYTSMHKELWYCSEIPEIPVTFRKCTVLQTKRVHFRNFWFQLLNPLFRTQIIIEASKKPLWRSFLKICFSPIYNP